MNPNIIIAFCAGILISYISSNYITLSKLQKDVSNMKNTLNKLAELNGIEPFDRAFIDTQVLELLKQNKKVKAVKLYRDLTGTELIEAKKYIDNLIENNKQ